MKTAKTDHFNSCFGMKEARVNQISENIKETVNKRLGGIMKKSFKRSDLVFVNRIEYYDPIILDSMEN